MTEKSTQQPQAAPARRRVARGVALGFCAVVATFLIAEIAVRVVRPTLPAQVIRSDVAELRQVDGIPVWRSFDSAERENVECLKERHERQVVVIGDSILFGSSLSSHEVVSSLLETSLNERHPEAPVCVLNFAQPGFSFGGKWVRMRQALERFEPDLIVFGLWYNDIKPYIYLEKMALNVGELATNEFSQPDLLGLPPGANVWLLENSELFLYASLVVAKKNYDGKNDTNQAWRRFADEELSKVLALAREREVPVLFVFPPKLSRSFAEQADELRSAYRVLSKFLTRKGADFIMLADELRGVNYEEIRIDPCCHYNALGMQRLEDVLAPRIESILYPDG